MYFLLGLFVLISFLVLRQWYVVLLEVGLKFSLSFDGVHGPSIARSSFVVAQISISLETCESSRSVFRVRSHSFSDVLVFGFIALVCIFLPHCAVCVYGGLVWNDT